MRILYLTPYVPTPTRTRPYNLIKALARRGNSVTLLCVAQGEGLLDGRPSAREQAALEELRDLGIATYAIVLPRLRSLFNCLRTLTTAVPLQAVYCWSPALASLLKAELGLTPSRPTFVPHPDSWAPTPRLRCQTPSLESHVLLHIEHLRAARYGLWLRSFSPTSNFQLPIVWDSVDCISYLFEQSARASRSAFGRLVTRLELARTRRYEARLLRSFNRTLVTSAADAAALVALSPEPSAPVPAPLVLPNGVDLAHFCPDDTPRQDDELVFSGKMSYHANITAAIYLAREVLPLIRQQRPAVHLSIVGSDPSPGVQALAGPSVTVTGYVPDMVPYLARAMVALAPMPYGAGIQNKVLEAMACATPVVATPQAVSALAIRPEDGVLIGATAAELAAQVAALLKDPARARSIGEAGRAYVEAHHDWNVIAARLEQVYRELHLGEK